MQVKNVTKDDAVAVAQLFNALRVGKFEVSGPDLQALAMSMRWLQNLSTQMQQELRAAGVAAEGAAKKPEGGDKPMRIKPNPVSSIKGTKGKK